MSTKHGLVSGQNITTWDGSDESDDDYRKLRLVQGPCEGGLLGGVKPRMVKERYDEQEWKIYTDQFRSHDPNKIRLGSHF